MFIEDLLCARPFTGSQGDSNGQAGAIKLAFRELTAGRKEPGRLVGLPATPPTGIKCRKTEGPGRVLSVVVCLEGLMGKPRLSCLRRSGAQRAT